MYLYRGQDVDTRVGFWWSDRQEDAEDFARQARSNLVLRVRVTAEFAECHLKFTEDDHAGKHGNWYRIPHEHLVKQSLAVEVIGGRLGLDAKLVEESLRG